MAHVCNALRVKRGLGPAAGGDYSRIVTLVRLAAPMQLVLLSSPDGRA